MALIALDHVSKIYPKGSRPALDDVSLEIERGDFVFLVGASGSGKTTLLSLLLREEEATEGEIRVAGNDLRRMPARQIPQYRRSIGFIFQDYKLLANKTVWQNVAFALEVIGTRRSTIKSLVPQVLKTVGLTGKERNFPHELSGGEQQRVAIARAYVNHPQILLADEPTGNLDPTTSLGIMEVLDAINRTGTTIVMATHNEEIVNSMRKRVVELKAGRIMRDESHGSYDSALFFPDAEVASRAHEAIHGDGTPAAELSLPEGSATDPSAVTNVSVPDASGDDGIARLANSVHSGRTGRYGEVFQSVEDTLTWGKGLDLESMAAAQTAASEPAAKAEKDAGDFETVEPAAVQADDVPAAAESAVPETSAPEPTARTASGPVPEPTLTETTQAMNPADLFGDGSPADDPAPDAKSAASPFAPPAPPAPPVPPSQGKGVRFAHRAGGSDDPNESRNFEPKGNN